MYGKERLLKLIEERIPRDQHAMLDYDGELLGENPPHLLATTLDKVVADFSKPAHDTTEELPTKENNPEVSKPRKRPAALQKSLLDLMCCTRSPFWIYIGLLGIQLCCDACICASSCVMSMCALMVVVVPAFNSLAKPALA